MHRTSQRSRSEPLLITNIRLTPAERSRIEAYRAKLALDAHGVMPSLSRTVAHLLNCGLNHAQ